MKSLRAFAHELFQSTCGIVKAQKIDDPHEDLPLTVVYVPKGTRHSTLIAPVMEGVPPPDVLSVSLQMARKKLGPPSIIIHAADAHMKVWSDVAEHDRELKDYERGDLANDPSSQEVLIVMAYCFDKELLVQARYMPYGYDDDGSIRFDEVIDVDEPPGGAMAAIIEQTFQTGEQQ